MEAQLGPWLLLPWALVASLHCSVLYFLKILPVWSVCVIES